MLKVRLQLQVNFVKQNSYPNILTDLAGQGFGGRADRLVMKIGQRDASGLIVLTEGLSIISDNTFYTVILYFQGSIYYSIYC